MMLYLFMIWSYEIIFCMRLLRGAIVLMRWYKCLLLSNLSTLCCLLSCSNPEPDGLRINTDLSLSSLLPLSVATFFPLSFSRYPLPALNRGQAFCLSSDGSTVNEEEDEAFLPFLLLWARIMNFSLSRWDGFFVRFLSLFKWEWS